MSRYSEVFPDQSIDSTGNTRIDGENVSINNALDVTDSDVKTKQPLKVDGDFYGQSGFYLKNQGIDDLSNVPSGFVAVAFDRDAPFLYSPDNNSISYFDIFNLRPIAEDVTARINDEIVALSGTPENPLVVNIPEDVQVPSRITFGSGVGNEFNCVFDFGNTDAVLHNLSTGEERFRGKQLGFRNRHGRIVSFRYFIVSVNPLVGEWHGGYTI